MKYALGQTGKFSKTLSESDIYLYAGLTGDMNELHVNEEYAKNTQFGGRIAHGLLTAGFISTVLGTKFPGQGTIYMEQNLKFCGSVRIGDTITASVEVTEHLSVQKGIIKLNTVVTNQEQKTVIQGYAIVRVPEKTLEEV